MDDRGGSRTAREHRASARMSTRLSSVGDQDTDDFSVIISPSPDSTGSTTDSTTPSGGLLAPSSLTSLDDNSLQRPNSVHSRPSSIAKPHPQGVPQLRNDAAPPELGLRGNPDIPVQAEAPYEGPSNPSHPYQMYPQRAMSISTISTTTPGPDGAYSGSRGPAHPYGLYPQSTATNDAQPGSVPVGFPGLTNAAYPRRVAPGGDEVASFTGSLAHSHLEELPPYTRYPDNGPAPKMEDSQPATEAQSSREERPGSAPQITPLAAIPAIPGAGGIGLATRDPEFGSTSSELGSPRLSTRSFTSDDDSHHEINTAARAVANEKPERRSWQQQATKKLWGIIPYWAVGLLGIALILMGVILGAVIGTFLSKHPKGPKGKPSHRPSPDLNGTQDVILLESVPSDLPDLEIGEWGLLPPVVGQAPSTCFEIPDQSQAWTCNTPFNLLSLDVQATDAGTPTSAYQLKFTTSKDSLVLTKYAWGTRSPAIPEHQTLRLVSDPSEPGLGPAWWVRVAYNKTVILPEDRLSNRTAAAKRGRRNLSSDGSSTSDEGGGGEDVEDADKDDDSKKKKGQPFPIPGAQEGDRPWICTWPDTVLELFVYPRQNNTFNAHAATASFSSWPGFPTPTSTSTPVGEVLTADVIPTGTPDILAEGQSAEPSGVTSEPPWTMPKFPPFPPPYPKIVRISERRVDAFDDAAAYCEQVEIIDGGANHRPHLDGRGRPIRVAVPERSRSSRSLPGREVWAEASDLVSRDSPPSECGCVWMVE